MIAETQQKSPPRPGAKRPPEKTAEKKTEQPSAAPTEETKPAATAPVEPEKVTAPELRAAYSKLKTEHKEATEKLTAAETRLKELEARSTEAQQRLEEYQKRSAELEETVKFADYEKSAEYKDKFYKPFVDAYQAARNKIASLKTIERKNDLEEVVQPRRQATAEDFDAIMRVQDDGEAAQMAADMFGPMANLVIYHREKIMELNQNRLNAIEEFRKKGGEREKQTVAQQQAMQEKLRGVFKKSVDEGISKYPQWFKADDGDEQGKAILEKGILNADSLFTDNSGRSPEQVAQVHAAFRNMAGAFPYVALKLHRAEAKIAELQKEIDQFKNSEPTEKSHERSESKGPLSVDDEIDSLARA